MWKNHKGTIIGAVIGAIATIFAAIIALRPQFKQNSDDYSLHLHDVPKVENPIGFPVICSIMEFSISETFEQIGPGWQLNRTRYLEDGEVHIFDDKPNSRVNILFNTMYALGKGSYEIEVDARQISGPLWSLGLALKVFDKEDIVFLSVRKDGRYRITRYNDKKWKDYSDWRESKIPPNTDKVLLRICSEDPNLSVDYTNKYLFFYINDIMVEKILNKWTDEFMLVGLFSTMNIHAAFDNLVISDYSEERPSE